MSERMVIRCPFCDHDDTIESKPDGSFPVSWVIRLHEHAAAHLRRNHSRQAVRDLSPAAAVGTQEGSDG